jgi:hypothetical protein
MSDFQKPLRDESYAPTNALQLRAVTRACFADEIAIDFPASAWQSTVFGTLCESGRTSGGRQRLGDPHAQAGIRRHDRPA